MRLARPLALSQLVLLAATAATAATAPTAPTASPISIADARALPLGTTVVVEGSVTVPDGIFATATFDQGFVIQDDTAGIYVSVAYNHGLRYHRGVRVTGTLHETSFGLLVVQPASLEDVAHSSRVSPVYAETVTTGDVNEDTEGLLVEVEGTVTRGPTDDMPFGYSVFIDDGTGETQIFIPDSTRVNPFRIPWIRIGKEIRVTGFSAQISSQYRVLPRRRGDIKRGR